MKYSISLNPDIPEDLDEKKPSRENPEDYSHHMYHLTFDDAGMDREPFIRVFEEFDDREEFEHTGISPVRLLNGEKEYEGDLPSDSRAYNSGSDSIIHAKMSSANGSLWGEYGPGNALNDEAVYSATATLHLDINGDNVTDAVARITEETDAPYLDSDQQNVKREDPGGVYTGDFTVPATFTEQDLTQSVDAWVERVSKVNELQEDMKEVANQYS